MLSEQNTTGRIETLSVQLHDLQQNPPMMQNEFKLTFWDLKKLSKKMLNMHFLNFPFLLLVRTNHKSPQGPIKENRHSAPMTTLWTGWRNREGPKQRRVIQGSDEERKRLDVKYQFVTTILYLDAYYLARWGQLGHVMRLVSFVFASSRGEHELPR